MKKLFPTALISVLLACSLTVGLNSVTGCKSAPQARTTQVATLKVVGASADASMRVAAQLLHDGKITRAQWDKLADIFDNKFQPAYNLAVEAVKSDLNSFASPEILSLSAQLASIIASYIPPAK